MAIFRRAVLERWRWVAVRHRYHRRWRNIFLSIQVWWSVWQISTGSDVESERRGYDAHLSYKPGESLTRACLWDRRMTRAPWFRKHGRRCRRSYHNRTAKKACSRVILSRSVRSTKINSKICCRDGHQNKKERTYQPILNTCTGYQCILGLILKSY